MQEEKEMIKKDSALHDLFMTILGAFALIVVISLPYTIGEPAADYPFYKGPAIFPMIILSVMVFSSLPACFRLLTGSRDSKKWTLDGKGFPQLPLKIFVALIFIFLIGFIYIGLELASFLFFGVAMYLIGYRLWWKLLLYSALYTGFILVLFKYLLDIYFPDPILFSIIGG